MLEDFLQDIYENALTLEKVREASFYSSIRHLTVRGECWNDASERLEKIIYDLKDKDIERSAALMQASIKARKSYGDWHTFSAVIDTEVVPKLSEYLELFGGIDVTEGDWTLESSKTGFLTVKDKYGNYLHSPHDPMYESFLYAYSIYKSDVKNYYIVGGGLGYLAYQLWKMSEGEADIYVFEVDEQLSQYSQLYGVMSFIDPEKLHIYTGNDTDVILEKYADEKEGKIVRTIWYWDYETYKGTYADLFRVLYSSEITDRAHEKLGRKNFDRNMELEHKYYDDLKLEDPKDEWLVVGAGPSVNDNIDFIRESYGKRTIVAINASLKWFKLHDIKPDLCTACDPNDAMIPHIEGLEDFSEDIPLIADILTNRNYMKMYRGPKYYIYSEGTAFTVGRDTAIGDVWEFGGTVTCMALEAAIKGGAKKVYLIGADLAYPDGVTYAHGVGHEVGKWSESEDTVISIDDKIIPTSIVFREYKYMMENQIADYPNVEVHNRSLHGAYIRGAFCGKWWEDLPEKEILPLFSELKKDSYLIGWREKFFIFWQMLAHMKPEEYADEKAENEICEAYRSIYELFKCDMKWTDQPGGKKNNGQTYIITDEFTDKNDPATKKVLELAAAESRKNKNVLIVNTGEKLGGKWIQIHDRIQPPYKEELRTTERVSYGKSSFAYFQFSPNMPDTQYYEVFLNSVSGSKPGKIIIAAKYSFLADYCSEVLDIPVERIV